MTQTKTLDDAVKAVIGGQVLAILQLQAQIEALTAERDALKLALEQKA